MFRAWSTRWRFRHLTGTVFEDGGDSDYDDKRDAFLMRDDNKGDDNHCRRVGLLRLDG